MLAKCLVSSRNRREASMETNLEKNRKKRRSLSHIAENCKRGTL